MDEVNQPCFTSEQKNLEVPVSLWPAELQMQQARKAGEAELQCVGSLQVQRQMHLGFVCGSLPVPTDCTALASSGASIVEAAIVPTMSLQSQRAMAPQYRMLPTQTDLNTPLSSDVESEQILPITAAHVPGGVQDLCMAWGNGYLTQPLARKCEALAVSALAKYGDEIDVVAPADILKQIFKIPYSKGRLSVAVHRVGRTLILNTGPDMEEGDKLVRRKKNQAKVLERSLFLKFAMQSVRAEACDCPTASQIPEHQNTARDNLSSKRSSSDVNAGGYRDSYAHVGWQFMMDNDIANGSNCNAESINARSRGSSKNGKRSVSWNSCHGTGFSSEVHSLKNSRLVGEQHRDPTYVQNDSEKHKRPSTEGFLRVLFWQLQELRMLLGSDLLLFSNEKHAAVSLHLWEIERQVTPLMWLDAWLDNMIASVPELAVCYHRNGVVQGYELLKTDDIFLLKGLSEDGTSFFHPHVVQQNALSVLRFLQENCKQDPGTYWLFKNAGEDLMQLFDLSVISKSCSRTNEDENSNCSLPSPRSRGKGSYSLPLGMLLYRVAHRLSRSQDPADRCKCANFFKKCLEFLDEQEHLFVRASAHEHVARLILRCYEELGSILTPLLLESSEKENGATKPASQPEFQQSLPLSESFEEGAALANQLQRTQISENSFTNSELSVSKMPRELGSSSLKRLVEPVVEQMEINESITGLSTPDCTSNSDKSNHNLNCEIAIPTDKGTDNIETETGLTVRPLAESSSELVQTIVDPVSARLAAVHHVSQAIKALRWQRQLQDVGDRILTPDNKILGPAKNVQLVPVCVCGEIDCIEVFDIRECEIGPFMDQKLWQLVLLLGESYLALGQAYKEDGQLNRALKAGDLACSVYGSMPQYSTEDHKRPFPLHQGSQLLQMPASLPCSSDKPIPNSREHPKLLNSHFVASQDSDEGNRSFSSFINAEMVTEKGLFWGQAWMLIGDIYIKYRILIGEKKFTVEKEALQCEELTMARDVMKEVKRLKKKLGQAKRSCNVCSLTSCSCESDRASSGNSASSSSAGMSLKYSHKQGKRSKVTSILQSDIPEEEHLVNRSQACVAGHHSKSSQGVNDQSITVKKVNTKADANILNHAFRESITPSSQLNGKLVDGDTKKGNLNADLCGNMNHLTHGSDTEQDSGKRDIFSLFQGPKASDKEIDLFFIAIDCYNAAVSALSELWQGSQELESALRKQGWAYNELGRFRLFHGNVGSAEADFEMAIRAFKEVKDYTNVVLVHCNIAHSKRAAAEALVLQLDSRKGSGMPARMCKQVIEDAKFQYGEALKYYGTAKEELKGEVQDLDSANTNLNNEVHTQYAHTYLRLGMLLAREEKLVNMLSSVTAEGKQPESGEVKGKKVHSRKLGITANDAMREAIALYESMGSLRAQEAAFAQFQLACHQRDCCLVAIGMQGKEHIFEKAENNTFQQAKRYLSLAERYWQKALNYYKASTHPDMFLEILMERSALDVAMAPTTHPNVMLESALSHLLEGRHAVFSAAVSRTDEACDDKGLLKPSNRVVMKFSQQLQVLLRTMLAAAQSVAKPSSSRSLMTQSRNRKSTESCNKGETHIAGRCGDVAKLKEMYRRALKSNEVPDLQVLYHMWMA